MPQLRTDRQKPVFVTPGLGAIVILFAAGISGAGLVPMEKESLLYCIMTLLVLLLLILRAKPRRHKAFSLFLLGLLFFLLGLQHAQMHGGDPSDPGHIYNLVDTRQTAGIAGILLRYPPVINSSSGPETRLLVRMEALYQPAAPGRNMVRSTGTSGLVLLTLKGLLPEKLQPGDHFLARAHISRPSTYSTPGSFNYKQYLADQSIFLTGWIQSPDHIVRIKTVGPTRPGSFIYGFRYLPERIRCQIADFLEKHLEQPARGLYKAILIGDRSNVPAEVLEDFTAAGCIHILAISGMHMGLLALVAVTLLTWLLKRSTWLLLHAPVRKIAVTLALLLLLLYALIAGFNIPVLRALLMAAIFILAILFNRPENLMNHILLAALIILVWKPGSITTASFQLSFSAVIAIALVYPKLSGFLFREARTTSPPFVDQDSTAKSLPDFLFNRIGKPLFKWFLAGITLTTAAMIGTFPLLLFHFNRISLAAPFSNLVVEPLVCLWSLVIGLAAALCIPLLPGLAKILFTAGSYGLTTAARICSFFAAFPYGSLWLPTPSPQEVTVIYLFLISSVAVLHLTGKQRRFSLAFALFFFCLLLSIPAAKTIARQNSGSAAVTFLDVGHGSAILLQLPGNKNILLDGGGAEGDRFNIGARVIAPFLWSRQISRLDGVVVSHPHADHYNGIPFILRRFHPGVLWINGAPGPDKEYRELLDLAGRLNIEIQIAETDAVLFQDNITRLLCVYNGLASAAADDDYARDRKFNTNDSSLVLRLETSDKSFLFPGDISAGLAEKLGREGKNLQVDVLMAPHHGSPSSMSRTFIDYVNPAYIAISAGRGNRFSFSAKSINGLEQNGIDVLSTGEDGTFTFNLKNDALSISRYQSN